MTSKASIKRSQATRDLMRAKALERGQKRSDEIVNSVRAAMQAIESEIEKNGGIYPLKDGVLYLVDVARLAKIHPTTFYTVKHRDLGSEVQTWLLKLQKPCETNIQNGRKPLASRIADWKTQYEGLLQSHRDTELALFATTNDLRVANAELESLRFMNKELSQQIAASVSSQKFSITNRKFKAAND